MRYLEFTPSAALRDLVERVWVLEVDTSEPRLDPILPDGRPEIIVHCGAPFAALEPDGAVRVQDRLLLSGQLRRAKHVTPTGAGLAAGATLRPHGAAALFGVPQHEL
ncbi:MAG TPA: DUF6597 domain-containing transcriptional factor, partial [Vicinamibacterales bacterium]|nr:DUF6597 domain-containing transcriptional factor [Vicinamibacterales bacterium]